MGRMAAHSGRRSFQETNLVTFRMWWTTHSCTSVCGNADSTAFRRPVNPSPHRMRMSCKPRALRSLKTFSQKRAPSVSSIHRPSTSCLPERPTPSTVYTHFLRTPLSVRTATRRPSHKEDRVHAFERPVLPLHNLLLQFLSDTRDELRRDLDAIDFFDVRFDLPRGEAPRIQRDHASLKLPTEVWRLPTISKLALRSRGVSIPISPKSPRTVGRSPIARVAAAAAFRIMLRIAEMLFHLELEKRLERLLHHALEELFCVHRFRPAAGTQAVHQLLLECFRIQGRIGK